MGKQQQQQQQQQQQERQAAAAGGGDGKPSARLQLVTVFIPLLLTLYPAASCGSSLCSLSSPLRSLLLFLFFFFTPTTDRESSC